jgi:hypothetical protein
VRSAVAQLICSSRPPGRAATQRGRLPRVSGPASGSCQRAGFDRSAGERPWHCRSSDLGARSPLERWPVSGTRRLGSQTSVCTEAAEPSRARRMTTTVRHSRRDRRGCDRPRPLPQRRSAQSLRSAHRVVPGVAALPRRHLGDRRDRRCSVELRVAHLHTHAQLGIFHRGLMTTMIARTRLRHSVRKASRTPNTSALPLTGHLEGCLPELPDLGGGGTDPGSGLTPFEFSDDDCGC